MKGLIIIPSKHFFKKYWGFCGEWKLNPESQATKQCADILLELNRPKTIDGNSMDIRVKIPYELLEAINKQFGCIIFAENFHDSIATRDDFVYKFGKNFDVDTAVIETAKLYSDTHQILILGEPSELADKLASLTTEERDNIGVFPVLNFADAFSKILSDLAK